MDFSLNESNYIPSGRQLERTPPIDVRRQLLFNSDNQEDTLPNIGPPGHRSTCHALEGDSCNSPVITASRRGQDPTSVIKGMIGYQLTPADLEFIRTAQREGKIKELQAELDQVNLLLKNEKLARDSSLATKEILPGCEQWLQLGRAFLSRNKSSVAVESLDSMSLFAQIKAADVQRVLEEERVALTQLEDRLAKALELREKEQINGLNQRLADGRNNVQRLMRELPNLQSKLTATEMTFEALQTEVNFLKEQATKGLASEKPKVARRKKAATVQLKEGTGEPSLGLRRSKRIAQKN